MFGARFDDLSTGESFELVDPLEELVARHLDQVESVLEAAAEASRAGKWVAGYVAYDAAPAFDDALVVRSESGDVLAETALAWFGVFGGRKDSAISPTDTAGGFSASRWTPMVDRATYDTAFKQVREHIRSGDTYQVNLTFPMRAAFSGDPAELYLDMVASQEAAYACHLWHGNIAVVSVSPERFFRIDDDTIVTRPMKGTMPRGRWTEEDRSRMEALAMSEKDRAENLMIVDLIRNDLGRISEFGSVEVDELFEIEGYRTVWQMTSEISARLRPDIGIVDVFEALFPCGSVTGAPKPRSMEIIADVEGSRRGVYCGAIGYLPPGDGRDGASFSVAIRTGVACHGEGIVEYGVGGGITWDSALDSEYDEALAKARVLTTKGPTPGLIETIRWDGGWLWIDEHLDRLAASATYFGHDVPPDIRLALDKIAASFTVPMRVRVELHGATYQITAEPAVERFATGPGPDGAPVSLEVDFDPVSAADARLFHKTTDRDTYTMRQARHDSDDVLLMNEDGHITETSIANVAFRFRGRWTTPPVDDGLLPGVMRQRLLEAGDLVEASVTVPEALEAEAVAVFNSVRGWQPATIRDPRTIEEEPPWQTRWT